MVNEPELKAQLDQMKAHEHQVQQQYNKAKRCALNIIFCGVIA
jgi:hypothetical protein